MSDLLMFAAFVVVVFLIVLWCLKDPQLRKPPSSEPEDPRHHDPDWAPEWFRCHECLRGDAFDTKGAFDTPPSRLRCRYCGAPQGYVRVPRNSA